MIGQITHDPPVDASTAWTPPRVLLVLLLSLAVGASVLLFAHEAGFRTVAFAFWVHFFLMFWANLLDRVAAVRFAPAFYRSHPIERGGRIYEWLGMRAFKRLMTSRAARALNPAFRRGRGRGRLHAWQTAFQGAETGHALAFGASLLLTGYASARGWWDAALWLFLANVFFNAYPAMLQRYNRARLEQLLRRGRGAAALDVRSRTAQTGSRPATGTTVG